jgi:hypothetical protein
MPTAPRIVERAEQPYVAVSGRVTMQTIGPIADRLPEVFACLGARGLEPAGAPFFKYDLIDMERQLEVYKTDPAEQPDMSKWETELPFRLAD